MGGTGGDFYIYNFYMYHMEDEEIENSPRYYTNQEGR
jgi:hypothetical protein